MKPLPHSRESEQSLLGSMLIDDSIINLVDLEQTDFYEEIYGKIYKLMKNIKSYGKKVDLVVIKEYLEKNNLLLKVGGITALVELTEIVPSSSNWKEYRDIIKEKSERRKIIEYARAMEQKGYEESKEMQTILQDIENISDAIFDMRTEKETGELTDFVNEYEEIKQKVIENKGFLGMKGPFTQVDKYTRGFIPGKVYTLVAFSNTGKSQLSYTFVCDFLKKGKRVDYFSLEVGKGFLFKDLLRSYYQKTDKEMTYDDYLYNMDDFEKLKIYDSIYKLEEIKTMIRANKPDFVFIDFIQNIQTSGSEYEKMTRIAIELQLLAIETGTTIFNLSQVANDDRFSNNQKIMPKGSGAIFSNSDVLFSLHRDGPDLYFSIVKNKYGPNNRKFLMNADFSRNIFKAVEEIQETNQEITY